MLDQELSTVKNVVKKLAFDMKGLENDLFHSEVSKKLIELEDRSQRNILHIGWPTENTSEPWDDCDKKVQEVLRDKLNIQDDIEYVTVWKSGEDLVNRQLSADLSVLKTGRRYCKMP